MELPLPGTDVIWVVLALLICAYFYAVLISALSYAYLLYDSKGFSLIKRLLKIISELSHTHTHDHTRLQTEIRIQSDTADHLVYREQSSRDSYMYVSGAGGARSMAVCLGLPPEILGYLLVGYLPPPFVPPLQTAGTPASFSVWSLSASTFLACLVLFNAWLSASPFGPSGGAPFWVQSPSPCPAANATCNGTGTGTTTSTATPTPLDYAAMTASAFSTSSTASNSGTSTCTCSRTVSPTCTPEPSATGTSTRRQTRTPVPTLTPTRTSSLTTPSTNTPSGTLSASQTLFPTRTPSITFTGTSASTLSPRRAVTGSPSSSATSSCTPTSSPTDTTTPTVSPSLTATMTATTTATQTRVVLSGVDAALWFLVLWLWLLVPFALNICSISIFHAGHYYSNHRFRQWFHSQWLWAMCIYLCACFHLDALCLLYLLVPTLQHCRGTIGNGPRNGDATDPLQEGPASQLSGLGHLVRRVFIGRCSMQTLQIWTRQLLPSLCRQILDEEEGSRGTATLLVTEWAALYRATLADEWIVAFTLVLCHRGAIEPETLQNWLRESIPVDAMRRGLGERLESLVELFIQHNCFQGEECAAASEDAACKGYMASMLKLCSLDDFVKIASRRTSIFGGLAVQARARALQPSVQEATALFTGTLKYTEAEARDIAARGWATLVHCSHKCSQKHLDKLSALNVAEGGWLAAAVVIGCAMGWFQVPQLRRWLDDPDDPGEAIGRGITAHADFWRLRELLLQRAYSDAVEELLITVEGVQEMQAICPSLEALIPAVRDAKAFLKTLQEQSDSMPRTEHGLISVFDFTETEAEDLVNELRVATEPVEWQRWVLLDKDEETNAAVLACAIRLRVTSDWRPMSADSDMAHEVRVVFLGCWALLQQCEDGTQITHRSAQIFSSEMLEVCSSTGATRNGIEPGNWFFSAREVWA